MTEEETLARIAAATAAGTPRDAAVEAVADAIREHGGYRWVGLYDVSETEVAIVAWSGGGPPAYPRFPRTHGLTSRAIAAAEPVVAGDVGSDPDYLEAFGDTRSEAIVPVLAGSAVVGTIDVESAEPDAFAAADVRFLERCRDTACALWPAASR